MIFTEYQCDIDRRVINEVKKKKSADQALWRILVLLFSKLLVLQWASRFPSFLRQIALWWAGWSNHSLHLRLGPDIRNYSPMHRQKQCWIGKIPSLLFSLQMTAWVLQKHGTVIVFLKNEIPELRGLSFVHNDRIHDFGQYLAQRKQNSIAWWSITRQIYLEHFYSFFQDFKSDLVIEICR